MRRSQADLDAAKRLLLSEHAGDGAAERAAAAVRVYETLSIRLTPLVGVAGVHALFARSLKLTAAEVRGFDELHRTVSESPLKTAELLHECLSRMEPDALTNAATALYGTLLALLIAFIGERLVSKLLVSACEPTCPKEMV